MSGHDDYSAVTLSYARPTRLFGGQDLWQATKRRRRLRLRPRATAGADRATLARAKSCPTNERQRPIGSGAKAALPTRQTHSSGPSERGCRRRPSCGQVRAGLAAKWPAFGQQAGRTYQAYPFCTRVRPALVRSAFASPTSFDGPAKWASASWLEAPVPASLALPCLV